MPFLTLDGYTFEVANGSAGRRMTRRGNRSRSYRGQMRDARRGARRQHTLKTVFTDNDLARAMTSIINGEGHVVFFRGSLVADTGLSPEVLNLSDVFFDMSLAPFAGFETGSLYGEAADDILRYDPQFSSEWTLVWWEQEFGGDWHCIAKRSDGRAFVDGVEDDAAWSFKYNWGAFVDDAGRVTLAGNGGDPTPIHHLCMLPFFAPDEMLSAWAANQKPWGGLPVLRMEGDIVLTDHEFVVGQVTGVDVVPKGYRDTDFGWLNNSQVLTFELVELATTFKQDDTVESQGSKAAPPTPVVPLTGAWLEPMVLETTDLTIGNISDKGAGAPTSPITITGAPTTEWGCLVNRSPTGDVVWAHKFIPVGGNVRAFISNTATKAGETYGLVCGWCESVTLDISQSDGTLITTLSRPAEYTVSSVNNPWGWAASFDLTTGALNWAQVGAFDDTCTQNAHRYRPQHLVFGGPTGDDLMMVVDIQTRENAASDVPNPTWGTGTVATFGPINSANIGAATLASQWIVQIDPTTGDPVSTTSHVANYNDDAANFGSTVNRSSIGETVVNRSNLIWNPTTSLWYLSSNFSCEGDLGIVGTYIGKGKTGEFQTRNVVDFGGDNTVKAYVCTFDSTLEPQNAVTLAADTVSLGNSFYAYNHEVHLVPDGSGDVFWGFQNMANGTPINLERDGVLGNYGGGQYSVVDPSANNSVTVRLNTDLEVVWESSAFASAYSSVGKGHSVNMAPVPNDSTKMLAAISTWNLNTTANNPTSLYGSANVSFDRKQTFVAAFDIATGAFIDEREMERAQNDDKMQILSMRTATSGPDNGITFALVVMSTDTNTTVQGFYDTAGVRQYVTSDYWNANGAVYAASVGGAVHLVAFDADGELLPSRCCPLSAIQDGNNLFNYWAGDLSLY